MRTKEEANDYRYFPDSDLLPVQVTEHVIEQIRQTLPNFPQEKSQRFKQEYGLSRYDATVLTSSRELANYFETTLKVSGGTDPKLCANWVMGELLGALETNMGLKFSKALFLLKNWEDC